jgi:hypothetical protein
MSKQLMDPSGEKAWIRHAAGAAKLIQLRGPKSYSTEFEKALFIAQTFPIVSSWTYLCARTHQVPAADVHRRLSVF